MSAKAPPADNCQSPLSSRGSGCPTRRLAVGCHRHLVPTPPGSGQAEPAVRRANTYDNLDL